MPQFVINRGASFYRNCVFAEVDCLLIGRARSNDIYLPDSSSKVSRYHAAIIKANPLDEAYFIRDLGSLHSTRVSGHAVYQHLLREGDIVEIADYELVFSIREHNFAGQAPLVVVRRQSTHDSIGSSTLKLTHRKLMENVALTAPQQEVIESLLQAIRNGMPATEMLGQVMSPLLKAAGASRGFIGLFRSGCEGSFDVIGRTGMSAADQIEITDEKFMEKLYSGRPVLEQHTLLAPILEQNRTVAFFCIDQPTEGGPFLPEVADFIAMIGRLTTERIRGNSLRTVRPKSKMKILEWPCEIIGKGKAMEQLRAEILNAAEGDVNVLIEGESGTGKELVARAIHAARSMSGPFLARNCASIPQSLAEAEIFGYAPRSGIANADPEGAPGWFEQANKGMLFMDEIQSLSPEIQDMFLRVLQTKEVWRIRGSRSIVVNLKIVAATDHCLRQAVEDGAFRKPLYYRFGKKIQVPPLRDRKEDIPLLAFYFLDRYASRLDSPIRTISHRAMQKLLAYDWPGNVRELENYIQTALTRVKDRNILFSWDFPEIGRQITAGPEAAIKISDKEKPSIAPPSLPLKSMPEVEKDKIMEALEATQGNISRAAKMLGFRSRQTILNKMDGYGIPRQYGDPQGS